MICYVVRHFFEENHFLSNASVRQVVLDKWFPPNNVRERSGVRRPGHTQSENRALRRRPQRDFALGWAATAAAPFLTAAAAAVFDGLSHVPDVGLGYIYIYIYIYIYRERERER